MSPVTLLVEIPGDRFMLALERPMGSAPSLLAVAMLLEGFRNFARTLQACRGRGAVAQR